MRELIKKIPVIGPAIMLVYRSIFKRSKPFANSQDYWIERYRSGDDSGSGSYSILAEFKAEILNEFVRENDIQSLIEYGCGDGNQLSLAKYPLYIGYDISQKIVDQCRKIFSYDHSKSFELMDFYADETAELTLSLDVLYYLVEDDVFESYMNRLFDSSTKYVIIYSSNSELQCSDDDLYIRHRVFTDWIEAEYPDSKLIKHIPNRYPFIDDAETGSFSDFYIFQK